MAVYVQQSVGSLLFDLARNSRTQLNLTLQPISMDSDSDNHENIWFGSQSATIFIAVSICILLSLCISWLVFYYCQRYRSRTAKDRLQNRLSNAAKKALTKIPLVNVNENPPSEEPCVICLDSIQTGDTVRQLGRPISIVVIVVRSCVPVSLQYAATHFIIIASTLGCSITDTVHCVISTYSRPIASPCHQRAIAVGR